jgi:nucleoside-diphosphate-sugar epimerase
VICGSCFEYGNAGKRYEFIPVDAPLEPTGPYHASKAAASMAALALATQRKLSMVILRPFHVFGEGESPERFWPMLRDAALTGRDLPMTLGEQVRDFIPVEQVADAFLRAVQREDIVAGSPVIENVGTGRPQKLREFAEYWWGKWEAKGSLSLGAIPYRQDEVMRYVPMISDAQYR